MAYFPSLTTKEGAKAFDAANTAAKDPENSAKVELGKKLVKYIFAHADIPEIVRNFQKRGILPANALKCSAFVDGKPINLMSLLKHNPHLVVELKHQDRLRFFTASSGIAALRAMVSTLKILDVAQSLVRHFPFMSGASLGSAAAEAAPTPDPEAVRRRLEMESAAASGASRAPNRIYFDLRPRDVVARPPFDREVYKRLVRGGVLPPPPHPVYGRFNQSSLQRRGIANPEVATLLTRINNERMKHLG